MCSYVFICVFVRLGSMSLADQMSFPQKIWRRGWLKLRSSSQTANHHYMHPSLENSPRGVSGKAPTQTHPIQIKSGDVLGLVIFSTLCQAEAKPIGFIIILYLWILKSNAQSHLLYEAYQSFDMFNSISFMQFCVVICTIYVSKLERGHSLPICTVLDSNKDLANMYQIPSVAPVLYCFKIRSRSQLTPLKSWVATQ